VAIISLLLSLLIPSFWRARQQTRRVKCLTNLRHIGTACRAYAAGNRHFIPRGNWCIWYDAFLTYLDEKFAAKDYRDVPVYRCPSFPDPAQCVTYVDSSWSFRSRDDMVGFEIYEPTHLSRFAYPASTIYMADNEDGSWRPIIVDDGSRDRSRLDVWHPTHLPSSDAVDITYGRRVARDRHKGGSNVLYVDGHAGWVGADEMTIDMWRDNWN